MSRPRSGSRAPDPDRTFVHGLRRLVARSPAPLLDLLDPGRLPSHLVALEPPRLRAALEAPDVRRARLVSEPSDLFAHLVAVDLAAPRRARATAYLALLDDFLTAVADAGGAGDAVGAAARVRVEAIRAPVAAALADPEAFVRDRVEARARTRVEEQLRRERLQRNLEATRRQAWGVPAYEVRPGVAAVRRPVPEAQKSVVDLAALRAAVRRDGGAAR